MKILMVHPHDLFSPVEPWTIRVVKFAEELVRKGHEVMIAYFSMTRPGKSLPRKPDRRFSTGMASGILKECL